MIFNYTFSYFLVTVACALIAITIIGQININLGSEREIKSFRNYVGWYLGFVVSNMVWVWINYGYLKWDGTVFSMINLISICVASYYWFTFVEARLSTDFVKKKVFHIIALLPLAIALALILSTPLTKLVFYYNDKNEYIHGPLYPTMFILAVSYLLFATVHIALIIKDAATRAERRSYLVLAAFLIFPVAAGLLDIVAENLPVMELALLFGTVMIYTHLLQSRIFNDSLTELNNRRASDNYLAEQIQSASIEEPLYYFMGDIDGFKQINDTYGHLEGDKALKLVGQALRKYSARSHNYVARWGGDEFCIIAHDEVKDSPEKIMKDVQSAVSDEARNAGLKYDLTMSMGYVKCTSPLGSPSKIIAAADEMLYKNKKAGKE